jgi:hypothetical protein
MVPANESFKERGSSARDDLWPRLIQTGAVGRGQRGNLVVEGLCAPGPSDAGNSSG